MTSQMTISLDLPKPLNLIDDKLFLGNIQSATSCDILTEHKIKRVLSVIELPIETKYPFIEYFHVIAEDVEEQDLLTHFEETRQVIADGHRKGHNVLVHCMAGISRSSTVVTAFLMNKYGKSYSDTIDMVRTKRSQIYPNEGFRKQLKLYEEMRFTLNANYKKFRRYLMSQLMTIENIEKYIKRRDYVESLVKVQRGQQYGCAKCQFKLFDEINVVDNEVPNKQLAKKSFADTNQWCGNLFVEPQKWMLPLKNDRVNCPKCRQTIGSYNNSFVSYDCKCLKHNGLFGIQIKVSKDLFKLVV
ncbi:uncharacterized protein LOC128958186 [Oppia nitens]|uniref:uncharacterized protein LOC128958186 n=1 Tax=Oppia nitens TaxID=1686743 RepID=UPI0023DA9379|nr:uncharacterized protein LOC128958186 [Oppia nitens]